tara:strand:- start:323 stop:505 length:183 start_codon:yes stop_codon:yes gene_type:complete
MGHYDDFWYIIHDSLDKHGLRKEFDKQLQKMQGQDKHKYKETRDRWNYAYDKVLKLSKKK